MAEVTTAGPDAGSPNAGDSVPGDPAPGDLASGEPAQGGAGEVGPDAAEPVAARPRSGDGGATRQARAHRVRSRRSVWLLVVLACSIVLVDLVSKLLAVEYLSGRAPFELVPDVLDIRLTRNSGAAFSLAGGSTVVLSLVAVLVVAVIVRTARRLRSRWWAVVLGLLAGGAVGNLLDRVFRAPGPLRGHVVDWIHLTNWPVFNVADSAISIGAVLAVVLSFRGVGLDGGRIGSSPASGTEPSDKSEKSEKFEPSDDRGAAT